jgi:hypothetical protein
MSEKQLQANQANAQHSTGPKTEAGKNRSRLNAGRHGLTGQVVILTEEDRIAHIRFTDPIIKSLAPDGPLEMQYAQLIAQDHWRLNRIASIEQFIFALGHELGNMERVENGQIASGYTHAMTFRKDAKQLNLLSLYASRIQRNIRKNTQELNALQAARKAQAAKALEEAELLAELAEYEGRTFDPQEFGFVFSPLEFRKAQLLTKARNKRYSVLKAMKAA